MRWTFHRPRTVAARWRWLVLFCLLWSWNAMAASVQATLDRNDVHLGETVTLNLRVDGDTNIGAPDLSALNNDFDVLNTSANSTLSIVNGKQSSQLIIGIALRPKHTGDLQIPSLSVAGSQTLPLVLHVDPPDASASANAGKDVFVDVTADSDHVYVGQQLLYTVRLFFDVNLNGGNLADPEANGVDLRKLGNDVDYESVRNGRRYHVIERRYALIPQRAGTLTIPSIQFQGEVNDPSNPNDPGGFFNPGGLFGNTTPVTAASPPLTLNVQAPPADWGKTTWLPARSLSLSLEGMPSSDKLTVGQPLNLRMVLDASGLSGDALPELSLPAIDGATVYPDQSTTSTHDDGQWLTGHRERSFAIFPQHAGPLTIPAITLTWFDVQTGQKRVATLPAHTFNVVAAAGGAPATASSSTQPAAVPSPATASSAATAAPIAASSATIPSRFWQWIALGSIALWLISVAVFVWLYRRRRPSTPAVERKTHASADSLRMLRQAFLDAARGSDRAAQARCLLAWARAERPGLRNLGEVADALASEHQRTAIGVLQREQYASASDGTNVDLATLFAKGFAWRHDETSKTDASLPPLYPFKLD